MNFQDRLNLTFPRAVFPYKHRFEFQGTGCMLLDESQMKFDTQGTIGLELRKCRLMAIRSIDRLSMDGNRNKQVVWKREG